VIIKLIYTILVPANSVTSVFLCYG